MVLNDITFKGTPEYSRLDDTPAKLKLRTRTLAGIHQNMARIEAVNSIFSIPSADLAKKKKTVEIIEKDEKDNMINPTAGFSSVDGSGNGFRQLKVSKPKYDSIVSQSDKMMKDTYVGFSSEPQVEEIKPVEVVSTPVVEELVSIPEVEIPEVIIEPGVVGEVSKVEEYVAPTIEEIREKVVPVAVSESVEDSALEEATAEEIFADNSKLKDEITELQNKGKELSASLEKANHEYNVEVNTNNELEKTLEAKKEEKLNKKKTFYQIASKQKKMMEEYKQSLLERHGNNERELEEVYSKTSALKLANAENEKAIENENNEIDRYDSLISAVSSYELPEEDSYQKRFAA